MNTDKKPLTGNGFLKLQNETFDSFLFQFNGISFFAAIIDKVLIPLNPAGRIVLKGIADKMERADLDRIPENFFDAVKDMYQTITDLNTFETKEYTNYYVFHVLKKQRILELPFEKQGLIKVESKVNVLTRSQTKNKQANELVEEAMEVKNNAHKVKTKHDFFQSQKATNTLGEFRKL